MLLELLFICHLTVTLANPFHKYPYVFLLDVGNEELQTTSEQIRVSIPGGSLALRYPATGEGDSIAHVRVSGIDFGTDLKANIIDGGPGYKYVVIVFMGNPGAAYDAVITVSTLDGEKDSVNEDTDTGETEDVTSSHQVVDDNESEDPNDSAETEENQDSDRNEPVPSASNFYDSAENAEVNGKEDSNDEDIPVPSKENTYKSYKENEEVKDYPDADDQQENQDQDDDDNHSPKAENYSVNEHYASQNIEALDENRNVYDKYEGLRPRLFDAGKVHPQEVNDADNEVDDDYNYREYSPEDPAELDQMFNDEEIHNDGRKYTDSNNNYNYDADDSSAVAY